jgi:hypothetical protein
MAEDLKSFTLLSIIVFGKMSFLLQLKKELLGQKKVTGTKKSY